MNMRSKNLSIEENRKEMIALNKLNWHDFISPMRKPNARGKNDDDDDAMEKSHSSIRATYVHPSPIHWLTARLSARV